VFVGGGTLEAVEAICNPDGRAVTPAGVEALIEKSLLVQMEGEHEPRVAMLETLREYAWDQVQARGEAEALRQAHASHYLALAERAAPRLLAGAEQAPWLSQLALGDVTFAAAGAAGASLTPDQGIGEILAAQS
jgi:hypothetical protein